MKAWICFHLAFHTPIDRISWRAFLWLVARSELYGKPEPPPMISEAPRE